MCCLLKLDETLAAIVLGDKYINANFIPVSAITVLELCMSQTPCNSMIMSKTNEILNVPMETTNRILCYYLF